MDEPKSVPVIHELSWINPLLVLVSLLFCCCDDDLLLKDNDIQCVNSRNQIKIDEWNKIIKILYVHDTDVLENPIYCFHKTYECKDTHVIKLN